MSFTRIECFSYISIPQIVISIWLISRVLKKLILTNFASDLFPFTEE